MLLFLKNYIFFSSITSVQIFLEIVFFNEQEDIFCFLCNIYKYDKLMFSVIILLLFTTSFETLELNVWS